MLFGKMTALGNKGSFLILWQNKKGAENLLRAYQSTEFAVFFLDSLADVACQHFQADSDCQENDAGENLFIEQHANAAYDEDGADEADEGSEFGVFVNGKSCHHKTPPFCSFLRLYHNVV